MAISPNRGAKVLIDELETINQSRRTLYRYQNADGGVTVSTAPAKVYSIFCDNTGLGSVTFYNSTGAANPFLSVPLTVQSSFYFGPNGLTLPLGLGMQISGGGGGANVTVVYAA